MNFFERQHEARRNSRILLLLFTAAVLGTVIAVDFVASTAWLFSHAWQGHRLPPQAGLIGKILHTPASVHLLAGGVTLLLTLGVSLVKTMQLRAGGGGAVARMLGGRWIGRATTDPLERRLLNVVDEMAIAAATRVPQVFVLDGQKGINAFAAGYDVSRAAIVVTRGTLDTLTRDELQGVIGHEFSHIVNGDMALNIRMIGLLSGILWIGALGEFIARAAGRGRSSRTSASGGALAFGLALWAVGSIGLFFGRLIKSVLSKEREYLADASSVQFTRNPEGLAGALDQIRANYSWVASPHTETVSHLFIAEPNGFLQDPIFGTHPPIDQRIARIAPDFDAESYRKRRVTAVSEALPETPRAERAESSPWTLTPAQATALVGTVAQAHLETARASLRALPPALRAALDQAQGAAGVVAAMLLPADEAARSRALASLEPAGFGDVAKSARAFSANVAALAPEDHLTVVDLALPTLRARPQDERAALVKALEAILASDPRVSIYAFAFVAFVRSQLQPGPAAPPTRYRSIAQLRDDAAVLISLVAHAGCAPSATIDRDFIRAFEAGAVESGLVGQVAALRRDDCTPEAASRALSRLQDLAPLDKARLVKALFAAITADGVIRPVEAALMRMIGGVLDCPLPPFAIGSVPEAAASIPEATAA